MYSISTLTSLTSTSSRIRYLAGFGLTRSQIVKVFREILNKEIRYQHVRNVLIQKPKKTESQKMTLGDLGLDEDPDPTYTYQE